jgi:hypothetical protein
VQIFLVISNFQTKHTTGLLFIARRKGGSVSATGRVQQGNILLSNLISYMEIPILWHLSGNSEENYENHQSVQPVFWPRFE